KEKYGKFQKVKQFISAFTIGKINFIFVPNLIQFFSRFF
uniref:Uncharacterized protein n=1 Tax=Ciona intestinalis TaxID=7719 RepID=H2XTD4_CIOIN